MATEPVFCVGCSSNTGVQELPLFSVFQTPPEAEERYMMLGLSMTASMQVIRPLMPAGPIFRGFQFLNLSKEIFCADVIIQTTKVNENKKDFFITVCFGG